MTADTSASPTPQENAELLQFAANLRIVLQEDDPRLFRENSRDLVLCLEHHRLLFVATDEGPCGVDGPDGRLLLAFTDDDAAGAWNVQRHPEDPLPASFVPFPATAESIGRAAGRQWSEYLAGAGAEQVVVNPAGPWSLVIGRAEFGRRPRLRRREVPGDANPWLDPAARATTRAHDRALLDELAAAIEDGDEDRIERLRPDLAAGNRLGSVLLASENQFLTGRWRLAHEQYAAAAQQLAFGAIAFGRYGEICRSVDALLQTAELLGPVLNGERSVPADESERVRYHAQRVATTLEGMRDGHRADAVAATLELLTAHTEAGSR